MTDLDTFRDPTGRCADPKAIIACCAHFGLEVLEREAEIAEASRLPYDLIGPGVATAETFAAVQEITRASMFGFRQDAAITGMLAFFPVRLRALPSLLDGSFDGVNVKLDLVCRPGVHPDAWYGWGFAGRTKEAGRALVPAAVAVQRCLYWAVPCYTRTATPDGMRVVAGKMGYRPTGCADISLCWIPPQRAPAGAAR